MRINLYFSSSNKTPIWIKKLISEVSKNFAEEYIMHQHDAYRYILSKEHLDRLEHAFKLFGVDVVGYRLQDDGPSWGFVIDDEKAIELQLRCSE